MLNFPGIYICVIYPIPSVYVHIEHKLACCCHFKYCQFEMKEKKVDFQLTVSRLLLCLHVCLLFYGLKVMSAEQSCAVLPTTAKPV
jgi:hypothetical protein